MSINGHTCPGGDGATEKWSNSISSAGKHLKLGHCSTGTQGMDDSKDLEGSGAFVVSQSYWLKLISLLEDRLSATGKAETQAGSRQRGGVPNQSTIPRLLSQA